MMDIEDPYLLRLAEIESGKNPLAKNPKSSAGGLFQFIDSTAKAYGLEGDDRYKPEKAIPAARKLTDNNARILRAGLKREPTEGELYLAHQQGASGALKLLRNPTARAIDTVGKDQIRLNGGSDEMTNADFAQKWIGKFEAGRQQTAPADPQKITTEITTNQSQILPSVNAAFQHPENDLSPDEQAELSQLEQEFGQTDALPAQPAQDMGNLTPAEQQELAALETEFAETAKNPASEGFVPEKPGVGDYARTAFDQSMQGATFGLADEVSDRIGAGIASVATGVPYKEMLKEARDTTHARLTEQAEEMPVTSIAANVAGGVLTGAAGASTKAGAGVGRYVRSGNVKARIAKAAGVGAASGGAYGAGTAKDGERRKGYRDGVLLGATVGAAVPAVGAAASGIKSGVRNAVIPKIDDAVKPLAQRARDFGIPLRADQVTKSRVRDTVQKVSQEMPFSGVGKFEETQRKAFTRAVAKTIGQDADDLGPDTIKKFLKENGEAFDNLLSSRTVGIDLGDVKHISGLRAQVDNTTGITSRDAKILKSEIKAISEQLSNGPVAGKLLGSIRSDLLAKSTGATVGKEIYSEILDQLDNIVQKNLAGAGMEKLKTARRQYKYFKTIEPLLEGSTDGQINPTALMNRVKASKYIKASRNAVGEDDLVDLAKIGKEFMGKKGGSDTFQKGALLGFGGGLYANPLVALGIGVASTAANRYGVQGVNTNQKLIDLAIKSTGRKALPKKGSITPLIGATAATNP